jgi:3'(2'), 5'-bisphosphate nucleotidase
MAKMKEKLDFLTARVFDLLMESGKYAMAVRRRIYKDGFLPLNLSQILKKEDTKAKTEDFMMNDFITSRLKKITGWQIISEENYDSPRDDAFWLVDPLDGSFCFSHNTGPYSILVSLIENGEPIFGAVHYPEENMTFIGCKAKGAYIYANGTISKLSYKYDAGSLFRGIISNASPDPEPVKEFLSNLGVSSYYESVGCPNAALTLTGCGDIMPMLHNQYEWDIAAYDAILRYSNPKEERCIIDMNGNPAQYGKYNQDKPFLNPVLIATPNKILQNRIKNGKMHE